VYEVETSVVRTKLSQNFVEETFTRTSGDLWEVTSVTGSVVAWLATAKTTPYRHDN
jgi:hypothetical protein